MTSYYCIYERLGQSYVCESNGGLDDFRDGWWCNQQWQFTRGDDRKFWIPASRIVYVMISTVADVEPSPAEPPPYVPPPEKEAA